MRICISILYTKDWEELADIVIPNVEIYAAKHGYELVAKKYNQRFSGYEKLIHVKELLTECGAVWSLDLDTLITNHNIKIESFLHTHSGLFICKDVNGLNAGSFIFRNRQWSIDF